MRNKFLVSATLMVLAAGPAAAASYTVMPLSGANGIGTYGPAVLLDNGITMGAEFTGGGETGAFAWGGSYLPADDCGPNGVADFSSFTAASPDAGNRYAAGNCGAQAGRNGFGYLRDSVANTTTQIQFSGNETFVAGVTAGGLVAGDYYAPDFSALHGYYMVGSAIVPFDPPGSISTSVFGISTQNTIFGGFSPSNSTADGFLLDEFGHYTYIVPAGAEYTYVTGLNGNNVAAGYFYDTSLVAHAFAWRKGQVIAAPLPANLGSAAAGINQKGIVAGNYTDTAGVPHGFVWSVARGSVITFDLPAGATDLTVSAVNNTHAEVTGAYYLPASHEAVAFVASCGGRGCF